MSPTPATPLPSMLACLSQSNGMSAASSTSSSSILAHALARASVPVTFSAAAIAALIFGTFVWPQFTFPVETIVVPLNVMLSTVCGAGKAGIQPTLGQIVISSFGTLQYFAYIVEVSTSENLTVKPRFFSVCSTISASCSAGLPLAPTTVIVSPPVYLPLGKPASLMYFSATAMLPSGCALKSNCAPCGPFVPPDCSKPLIVG